MKWFFTLCMILTLLMTGSDLQPIAAIAPPGAARVALVDRLGGASLAVAVQGEHAFVGQSAEFAVLDIADRGRPRRIAYLPLAANDIVLDGDYAYVTNKHGLVVIDIADPATPTEVEFLTLPHALGALAVENGFVYATAPAAGLYIIDGASSGRLVQSGFLRVPQIEGVAVLDNNVYLATVQGLKVISVSDPGHPALVGAINAPVYAEAVKVVGRYAYLTATTGGLTIVDIADPTQPKLVGAIEIPGYTKNLQVIGDTAYVANGNRGVVVIDVGNRRQPHLLGVSKIGALVTDVAVVGDALLATDVSDGGLYVLDAAHPVQLNMVGVYRAPGVALDVASAGDYAYVATGQGGDITIVNQVDPAALVGVGFQRTSGMAFAVHVSGHYLFAFGAGARLEMLDISNPARPVESGSYEMIKNGHIVAMQSGLCFVADESGMLYVFDTSLTDVLNEVGRFSFISKIQDAVVSRTALLVAGDMQGAAVLNHTGEAESASPTRVVAGNVQFVEAVNEVGYVLTSDGKLSILNLAAQNGAQILGELALDTTPHALLVHDRRAFVAAGEDGVFIVDVTNPSRPVVVAVYDTPGVALNVEIAGDRLLVADGFSGLLILAINADDASAEDNT
jgi:hypothetical protein